MGEVKSKKPRKSYVSEIDISTLIHRYPAPTLLAMLQEVAHVQDSRMDWNHLVKKTATGITNPREYQMLWRHVAYGDALLDRVDGFSKPLDDDSDLECELEAFPQASADVLAEAAACVKVLIASGVSNDPPGSNVEAPLTITIPKVQVTKAHDSSVSSVPKQPQQPSVASAEGLDSNGAVNTNAKRKRKQWTDEEDAKLIAAVNKRSDYSWPHISKTEFDGDRTPSMLAQRWAFIKKRDGIKTVANSGGSVKQPSEAQLNARRAMEIALENKNSSGNSIKSPSNVPVSNGNLAEASPALPSVPATQATQPRVGLASSAAQATQPSSGMAAGQQHGGSSNQQVAATKMTVKKPKKLSPDSMVKAAAVAAGARIATPSDAATLLKAVHTKSAVHIMPGSSLPKSSLPGAPSSLPNNVHFIRRPGPGVGSKPHPAPSKKVHSAPSTKSATVAIQPSTKVEDSATHSPSKAEKKQPQDQNDLKPFGQSERTKGRTLVLVKASKEKLSGDEMVATKMSNGLSKLPQLPHKQKSEPLPCIDEVTSKGSEAVKPASVGPTLDNEKNCESKNEVKPEEQPVAMDIDGEDDKEKPEKQPDGEENSKK